MAKKRVHEIASAQGLSTSELLARLRDAGIDAKVALSAVDEDAVARALSDGESRGADISTGARRHADGDRPGTDRPARNGRRGSPARGRPPAHKLGWLERAR